MTSALPVSATSTWPRSAAAPGSALVIERSNGGHEPGRVSGTTGSRNSRATADSTAWPGILATAGQAFQQHQAERVDVGRRADLGAPAPAPGSGTRPCR